MCLCFVSIFFKRKEVDKSFKQDFNFFVPIGILTTIMGFVYHYLRSQGKTVQDVQLLWDFILYTTVFMSFFYTSLSVKIFSSSEKMLKGWKWFCKIKGVLFVFLQYNMAEVRVHFKDAEILIFLISSLLPVFYLFIGFLVRLKNKDFHLLGLASFLYLAGVGNRIFGKDLSEVFNANSIMHLGIVVLLITVFKQIRKKDLEG